MIKINLQFYYKRLSGWAGTTFTDEALINQDSIPETFTTRLYETTYIKIYCGNKTDAPACSFRLQDNPIILRTK